MSSQPAPSRLPAGKGLSLAGTAVERVRLSVAAQRPPQAARTPFVTVVVVLLGLGVVGLLAFNTSMQQISFTATNLTHEAQTLAARQQSLEMELEQFRDPQRVAAAAKRLGMVPAPNPAFLRLTDGRILGDAVAASGADAMRINPIPAAKPRNLGPRPKVIRVRLTRTELKAQQDLREARQTIRQERREQERGR